VIQTLVTDDDDKLMLLMHSQPHNHWSVCNYSRLRQNGWRAKFVEGTTAGIDVINSCVMTYHVY